MTAVERDDNSRRYVERANEIEGRRTRIQREMETEEGMPGPFVLAMRAVAFVLVIWILGSYLPHVFHQLRQHGLNVTNWQLAPNAAHASGPTSGAERSKPKTENSALEDSVALWALIGDSFGVVNALFSGLAFAFVIVAILLQSRELRLQRLAMREAQCETALARIEYEQMVDAQQASERQMREQSRLMAVSSYLTSLAAVAEAGIADKGLDDTYSRQIRKIYVANVERVASRLSRQARDVSQLLTIERSFALERLGAICRAGQSILEKGRISQTPGDPYSPSFIRRTMSRMVEDTSWVMVSCQREVDCRDVADLAERVLENLCKVRCEARSIANLMAGNGEWDSTLLTSYAGTATSVSDCLGDCLHAIESELENERLKEIESMES